MDIGEKLNELSKLIGNTPMSLITVRYKDEIRRVFAKLEYYNYTGSIKDRMALYILQDAYKNGLFNADSEICEATSGNTGISFAALGSFLGNKVIIFMPDWMSEERKSLIRSLGAKINLVTREEGGFLRSLEKVNEYAEKGNVFLPKQFENDVNRMAHYTGTGPEIWKQMKKFEVVPDAFTAGVGSGGTVMGVGDFLRSKNKNCKIYPVEPANSPTMTTGGKKIGSHRIQGISDDFIPPIVKLDKLDEIISIDDGDAIIAAQMLAKVFGLGVGISSGANLLAALAVQQRFGHNAVATVFPDDNKKYLSTDYSKEEKRKEEFMTSDLELLTCEISSR